MEVVITYDRQRIRHTRRNNTWRTAHTRWKFKYTWRGIIYQREGVTGNVGALISDEKRNWPVCSDDGLRKCSCWTMHTWWKVNYRWLVSNTRGKALLAIVGELITDGRYNWLYVLDGAYLIQNIIAHDRHQFLEWTMVHDNSTPVNSIAKIRRDKRWKILRGMVSTH